MSNNIPGNITTKVKPCGCPDKVPQSMSMVAIHDAKPVHVHYVLHDGNDRNFYSILTQAILKGACKYGDPIFHEDGTLEFPMDMPEEVYGFLRVNATTFRSLWPDCVRRTMGVFVHGGLLAVAGRCNHYLAEHFTRPVSVDQCQACPARCANPRHEKSPKTAAEFFAHAEAKAKPDLIAKLGAEAVEKAEERLKAWRFGRMPLGS